MRRLSAIIAAWLLLPSLAPAQWSLDGYVVTFPMALHQQPLLAGLLGAEEQSFAELTRLRLRPSVELSPSTFVRLEYELSASYFSSTGALLAPSASRGQVADLTWDLHSSGRWTFLHGIDRFFLKTMAGSIDLTLGRQRIAWGAGRIWNPTDLFNPLNPASFSKIEKDGVDAATATVRLGDLSDLTAVWNPQRNARSSGGIRARTNWEGIDGAVMVGRFEDRWVVGGDITGDILDAGVRAEGVYVMPAVGSAFPRIIVGVDNQFSGRWYGMAEFLFNGEGFDEASRYELGRLMTGQILQVARRYVIFQSSYLIHPLVTAQASLLRNLDDGSGFAGGTVSISLTDEASLALGGQYTFGRERSEYWYYPRSTYLRADLFF
ncbi:MAG: hypothetical protein MUE68_10655 [Bacteroidetes bacterium]|jgi:hypothetical protein|nr:hypothetical protein [Bacteroidota bacterium]